MEHCVLITILNSTPHMEKSLEAILKPRKIVCFKTRENYLTFSGSESMTEDILHKLTRSCKKTGVMVRKQKVYRKF